ncbi:MAG TPA: glycoside hydrolase family 3 N-terminal domain-containing protein [Chitinophagales bacterium]|nr:glycoside hydrolase family 3 N-terminal domain-containing protein [Chitinophagales bacterium]
MWNKKQDIFIVLLLLLLTFSANAAQPPYLKDTSAAWVDSVLNSLTLEEKIGQLFMVAAYSNKDETHYQSVEKYIRDYKVGGLIFFQGTAVKQAELTNRYQAAAKTPLWIGFDGEWGLGMRLDNTISYPRQLTLGAIDNTQLIYDMGKEFARQMKRIGIHINFAPDIDVNNNPNNPVINDRSFGDNKFGVTRRALTYMMGMQENGILASGKHFPGHGDTDVDSHKDLPVLKHSKERLESVELYPFRQFIRYGIGSIMVAHMNVQALDNTPNLPSTLSPKVVQQKLKDEMGFQGLVFTDAMNMKGVAKFYPSGKAEVKALLAGCDVMLFPDNVDSAIQGVRRAVTDSIISDSLINSKVRKILAAKYWLNVHRFQPLDLNGIDDFVNNDTAKLLKFTLLENAVTVVRDSAYQIPVINLQKRIAHVGIGSNGTTEFSRTLDKYAAMDHFYLPKNSSYTTFMALLPKLKAYNLVLVDFQDMSRFASKEYGITDQSVAFVKQLNKQNPTILTVFGTPYSLKNFQDIASILVAYGPEPEAQSIAAQVIFGARGAEGTLPVTVGRFQYGDGECTNSTMRLKYGSPLEVGMNPQVLQKIDSIALKAIKDKVFPGCQILVAKDGNIIYEKAFGMHTYGDSLPVLTTDLFDIASVTKVTATLPLVMKMEEQGRLDVDHKLGDYFQYPENSNKKGIRIKDLLCHQAGLPAWIPFYKSTLDVTGKPDSSWYAKVQDSIFSVRIGDSLFLKKSFQDSVKNRIYTCELGPKSYKYSDLGYYLLQEIIEHSYKDSLQRLANRYVYAPLGMHNTLYNPKWNGIPLRNIVPTELEKNFRQSLLWGTVHDQGAALLGGVAGHAGLFSNANDLAKYFQLLLNEGVYGGYRYYDAKTVKKFTTPPFAGNRRAMGFDKPAPKGQDGPTCDAASPLSFGHTGFTGTMAWADPEHQLIFIFLSNRVYPDSEVNQLAKQNIRPKIQQVIYEAIGK